MTTNKAWWQDFFIDFRPVFGLITPQVSARQARYIIKKLHLKPGSTFLDCPCGVGRISLPLARQGVRVTGVDFMASYLDEIRKQADKRGLKINLVQADMRRITFKNQFDGAGSICTSFGFFDKESDNQLVLKKVYQALKPGGKFLLHVINRDWIIAHFEAKGWMEVKGLKVLEERSFDYRTSTLHGLWRFLKDGQEVVREVPLRLYAYHELYRMFDAAGFVDIQAFGTMQDEPLTRDHRFIHIFGTKPKKK
jgi:2-polyprenyl-3-methyl-5-hydroxy-6-metoxy-1,4-benzoquinol methylase